jgi:hypothetical protein
VRHGKPHQIQHQKSNPSSKSEKKQGSEIEEMGLTGGRRKNWRNRHSSPNRKDKMTENTPNQYFPRTRDNARQID